jgi:hypothetical protein
MWVSAGEYLKISVWSTVAKRVGNLSEQDANFFTALSFFPFLNIDEEDESDGRPDGLHADIITVAGLGLNCDAVKEMEKGKSFPHCVHARKLVEGENEALSQIKHSPNEGLDEVQDGSDDGEGRDSDHCHNHGHNDGDNQER